MQLAFINFVIAEVQWPLISLSVLTAIFQVNLGYPVFIEAKDEGSGGDNC